MTEEQNIIEEESSIDFKKIFQDLLKHKKLYYKVLAVTAVFAVIYTLSLPNFYKVTVKLSPELSSRRNTNSLSNMASMFGINLQGAAGNATEALFPTLYPDLMNSVAFHTTLFDIPVHRDKEDSVMTYYTYLSKGQKAPWWSEAMDATTKAIASLFAGEKKEPAKVDPFRLTKKQAKIVKSMEKRIVCDVDKKTMMITIEVTDQDPLICATMADSVQQRLQDFITDYRTKKARNDLEFSKKAWSTHRLLPSCSRQNWTCRKRLLPSLSSNRLRCLSRRQGPHVPRCASSSSSWRSWARRAMSSTRRMT